MTPLETWNLAMLKDWTMEEVGSIQVGDLVDTGERIRRVTAITIPGADLVTLHFKDGTPYEAEVDNLIDVWREAKIGTEE